MTRLFMSGVQAPPIRSPQPLWFVTGAKGLLVRVEGEQASLPRTEDLQAAGAALDSAHYLGSLDGEDCFALASGGSTLAGFEDRSLRALYPLLGEERFAVAGRAIQIVDWDQTHRFCGRCGTPTQPEPGERVKVCPNCKLRAYPRLSPAVIVLVRRDDKALLARGARFPAAFYSTLAGFVEPGESLEETVAREIREEVGIEVTRLRYFGSQPWPFPNSLMIGFHADHAGGEIQVDGKEIIDAAWFTADALPQLPPRLSIARALIDAWVQERSRVA
jgi:NAD+ diphosphatase